LNKKCLFNSYLSLLRYYCVYYYCFMVLNILLILSKWKEILINDLIFNKNKKIKKKKKNKKVKKLEKVKMD
jgi:hypothetical protein